jgi:hypothetical protein
MLSSGREIVGLGYSVQLIVVQESASKCQVWARKGQSVETADQCQKMELVHPAHNKMELDKETTDAMKSAETRGEALAPELGRHHCDILA